MLDVRSGTSIRLVAGLGAVLALAACSGAVTEPRKIAQLPRPLTNAEQLLATGSTDFGLSLLREIDERTAPEKNIFISPLSASMALGMTATGAAGTTLDSMRSVLGYPGMSIPDIGESYRDLIDLLRGLDPAVDFRIANSIWYRLGLPVEQSFLDAGSQYFDAEIAGLDFSDPAAANVINDWVRRGTNDKIDKIVDEIPDSMVMYLINAIYFKGSWASQFDKSRTSDQTFFAADGSTKPVPMMYQSGTFPAASTPEYRAIEMPYGGGAYSMVVVVPRPDRTVDSLIASLDAESWQALLDGLQEMHGDVYLPRFRLEWSNSLVNALKAMGMGIAFQGGAADFSGISKEAGRQLFISSVDQKTFVDVDEEGTEAAAVTAVGVGITSAPPPLLRADRPFLFAIRERFSGTLLFIGKMAIPPT